MAPGAGGVAEVGGSENQRRRHIIHDENQTQPRSAPHQSVSPPSVRCSFFRFSSNVHILVCQLCGQALHWTRSFTRLHMPFNSLLCVLPSSVPVRSFQASLMLGLWPIGPTGPAFPKERNSPSPNSYSVRRCSPSSLAAFGAIATATTRAEELPKKNLGQNGLSQ